MSEMDLDSTQVLDVLMVIRFGNCTWSKNYNCCLHGLYGIHVLHVVWFVYWQHVECQIWISELSLSLTAHFMYSAIAITFWSHSKLFNEQLLFCRDKRLWNTYHVFHVFFQVFAELNHITDSNLLDQRVKDYNKEVKDLWDKLMALELQLVDQFEVSLQSSYALSIEYHGLCMKEISKSNLSRPNSLKQNGISVRTEYCF